MASPEMVKEWLQKAEEDFQFAVGVLEDSTFYAQICLHFNQAAEKFLKAFMVAHDLESLKVHDLLLLLDLCSKVMPELQAIREECKFLNPF
jgi:HEPN domain-containing protein